MNNMNKTRTYFITIFTAIWSALGILAIPWSVLLFLNVLDYATGIAAAPYRADEGDQKPVKSYKSIRGIYKKVCMHLLVVIGCVIDITIRTSIPQTQWPTIFAIVIAMWLTFNEILSILENMEDIGAPIPPFLKPIMTMMRKQVENKMQSEEDIDE